MVTISINQDIGTHKSQIGRTWDAISAPNVGQSGEMVYQIVQKKIMDVKTL